MIFLKRLGFFSLGVILGLIIMYSSNKRVLNDLSSKEILCKFYVPQNKNRDFIWLFHAGKINFLSTINRPFTVYKIHYNTYIFIVENREKTAIIQSVKKDEKNISTF
ncbi:MAG TPA: hypothetical protein VE128_01250 [Candidatus Angelobacter sp.]|jgi:hypothetical protein|nr:hypothetical protein [Candidatus Angelobacter sp.]